MKRNLLNRQQIQCNVKNEKKWLQNLKKQTYNKKFCFQIVAHIAVEWWDVQLESNIVKFALQLNNMEWNKSILLIVLRYIISTKHEHELLSREAFWFACIVNKHVK